MKEPLSQRNQTWKNTPLGWSTSTTIGTHGCTITGIAYLLHTTPIHVNKRLKEVNGYANTNLVIWSKLEQAFPGVKFIKRAYRYDNNDVLNNIPCLVEVDGTRIGASKHWVVYTGNGRMMDPWFGNYKKTSYYRPTGYTVLDVSDYLKQEEKEVRKMMQHHIKGFKTINISTETWEDSSFQEFLQHHKQVVEQRKRREQERDMYQKKLKEVQKTVKEQKDEIAKLANDTINCLNDKRDMITDIRGFLKKANTKLGKNIVNINNLIPYITTKPINYQKIIGRIYYRKD